MQQTVIVPYVQPSIRLPPSRPYHGAKVRRGKIKVYRGCQPVRNREQILTMAGREV